MTAFMMDFGKLAIAGVGVAVLHALLPNHWLPFIAAGRSHGWSRRQLLGFTLLVTVAHALTTLALSVPIALVGQGVIHLFADHAPKVSGIILIALGLFFLALPRLYGHRHIHHHECERCGDMTVTLFGLFLALTLSPCEGLLPLFFAASVQFGWVGTVALAAITGTVNVVSIVGIVSATRWGLERRLKGFNESHERWVVSGLIIALGIAMLFGWGH